MYRFPTLFTYVCFMMASLLTIHCFNTLFHLNNNFSLKMWLNHDVRLLEAPIRFWNRNNSTDKFCVWFNFTQASKKINDRSVSLCTHGSIGYSRFVFDHAQNWDDSISVAILVDPNGFIALKTYLKLFKCNSNARKKVSTHLVWKTESEKCSDTFILDGLLRSNNNEELINSCNVKDHINKGLFHYLSKDLYYTNSLRNIARKGASTNLHLIADIENHFSFGASKILKEVLKNVTEESKTTIIVRRFEYNISYNEPRSVKDLWTQYENKQAFPFHHFYYAAGHCIPGLFNWFNYSQKVNVIPMMFQVAYQSSVWEPQLIVHASAPYHFEGFSLVRDQTALPYELCRAGYNFVVASHVFSFHKGIKPKAIDTKPKSKYALMSEERSNDFIKYLNNQYGDAKISTCKTWL